MWLFWQQVPAEFRETYLEIDGRKAAKGVTTGKEKDMRLLIKKWKLACVDRNLIL